MPTRAVAAAGLTSIGRGARVVAQLLAEIGPRGRLDAIGAVAEIDRVQILGQDLDLAPLVRELEGQRRLAELLEHRPVVAAIPRSAGCS